MRPSERSLALAESPASSPIISEVKRLFFRTISRMRTSIRSYYIVDPRPEADFAAKCRCAAENCPIREKMRRESHCYISILIAKAISADDRADPRMSPQGARHKRPDLVGLFTRRLQALPRRDFVAGAALGDDRWFAGEPRDLMVDPLTGGRSSMLLGVALRIQIWRSRRLSDLMLRGGNCCQQSGGGP